MSTVKDVAELLSQLAKIVKDTHSILKAITDGKEYLKRRFPSSSSDFSQLLLQMQITMEGLAKVTAVAQNFRFTMGSDEAKERDLARFNNHVIKHQKQVELLRDDIKSLKNDCDEIRKIRDELTDKKKGSSWSRMFGLVGLRASRKRDELTSAISNFYADDQAMIYIFEEALKLTDSALREVNEELGPPGHAYVGNVPNAARILGVYADLFEGPHAALRVLADELGKAAETLK